MSSKRADVRDVLRQIEQRPDRSPLFHWMVEHHDEMVNAAKGGKLIWTALCVTFATLGLTDQRGQPASARTARETWYQVRKIVAKWKAALPWEHSKPS